MSALDPLAQMLINYGLAGVVIYIFYKLLNNELKDLKISIDKLADKIDRLIEKMP